MHPLCAECVYWEQSPHHDSGWCAVAAIILARAGFSGVGSVPVRAEGSCPYFDPDNPLADCRAVLVDDPLPPRRLQ